METTTIRQLFSDQDRYFRIPSYQRAYSWEKDHVLQFLHDLKDAHQNYYLGHFLFEERKGSEGEMLIIDGQQRLTTCIIFLSSLCEVLLFRKQNGEQSRIDPELSIRHTYLRDQLRRTQRLTTVQDDNNFFVHEIVDRSTSKPLNPTTESQERVRLARGLMDDALEKETTAELERWYALLESAECTKLVVRDTVKAAQIFAFQNDRGKGLTKIEVLKAFFMLQLYLHHESDGALQEDLRYLENDLSSIYRTVVKIKQQEDDVLLHYWRAHSDSNGFNSRDAVSEVKQYIAKVPKHRVSSEIKSFVSGLASAFQFVEQFESLEDTDATNLMCLDNMALAYPFLFRAHLHGATTDQILKVARLLENITFRYLLRGGRAEIQSRLNHFLSQRADTNFADLIVSGMIEGLRNNEWWDYWSERVMLQLLDGSMYGNRVDNYVLWRYEMHLCSKTDYPLPLKVKFKDLIRNESIEHIAPQTEPHTGAVANGYGLYEDKENAENGITSGGWLHRLGNLMLISLGQNSSYGNGHFKEKVNSYGKDNLLNQQKEVETFVANPLTPVWDKQAIQKRHEAILAAAKEIWSLDAIAETKPVYGT